MVMAVSLRHPRPVAPRATASKISKTPSTAATTALAELAFLFVELADKQNIEIREGQHWPHARPVK
jgi:hypothetical protein